MSIEEREQIMNSILDQVLHMSEEEIQDYLNNMNENENQTEVQPSNYETSQSISAYPNNNPADEQNSHCFEKHNNVYYWKRSAQTFLVSVKPNDELSERIFVEIIQELKRCKITVLVDPLYAQKYNCTGYTKSQLHPDFIDLALVVGGDGSLLFMSGLFPSSCPPTVLLCSTLALLVFLLHFKHQIFNKRFKTFLMVHLQQLKGSVCKRTLPSTRPRLNPLGYKLIWNLKTNLGARTTRKLGSASSRHR
ncbi:Inorganic_polyphosphate/ATP-NAD kinase [Hexamita inflata]|uniref:Putative n=1 Tax=Hexamita inflata TaxID=28002 RepID=A0ABP1GGI9_9EUKA